MPSAKRRLLIYALDPIKIFRIFVITFFISPRNKIYKTIKKKRLKIVSNYTVLSSTIKKYNFKILENNLINLKYTKISLDLIKYQFALFLIIYLFLIILIKAIINVSPIVIEGIFGSTSMKRLKHILIRYFTFSIFKTLKKSCMRIDETL